MLGPHMKRTHTLPGITLLFWAGLIPLGVWAQEGSTREVTDNYVELTFSQQYDALIDVYSADAVFHDPTADVFGGQMAEGPVTGASRIVALQKSWGLAETVFDVRASFTVGEYSLYRGTLRTRYNGSSTWTSIPFVTTLRANGGRITERTDFGEYIDAFQLSGPFESNTPRTREVADAYLKAYLDGDVEAQVSLLDPDVQFQDPTAKVYGPSSGELFRGSDILAARRRQLSESLTDFDLDVSESFVGNHHAVYMGTTRYTLRTGQRFAQPAVFVIEVRDGKVTRHWDFVDYTIGPVGSDYSPFPGDS